MKRTAALLFIIITAFAITGCSTGVTTAALKVQNQDSDSRQWTIKDGDHLQETFDKAADGDEIILSDGEYTVKEPIVISGKKDLTVTGSGNTRILGEFVDKQIFVIKDCGSIIVRDIRAWHKRSPENQNKKGFDRRLGSVVYIENCSEASFENCELEGCGVYGVYASETVKLNLSGCYLHHNSWRAIGAVAEKNSTNITIRDCTITNNLDFIEEKGRVSIVYEGSNVIKLNNAEGYNAR